MMKFIDLFHSYVKSQPDHPALVDGSGTLTYSMLDAEAEALAGDYAGRGIGPGDAVAVKVPYCKDIMVHAIAILKLGAVYVPVDNVYPEDRVQYMIEDSGRQKLDEDVALILYTSGTTGRPKGVVHTQESLMAMVQWPWKHLPKAMSPMTRCGVVTGFTFVATTMMLFGTLAAGGTLCFASEEERVDMYLLNKFIRRNRISHIFMSASLGMAMMESYDTRGTLVMVGGEKLRNFTPKVEGQRLLNCYGSTEGVMVCSAYVNGDEEEIPIGKPCPGVSARIIDENMQEVKTGEVGELTYTAAFMSSGYLHLAEQTAAKWFYVDGVRYYHTGDRVRQEADGNICCLGRTDNMVKIRGFRVETGEIENQVMVAARQVIAHGEAPLGQVVVAVRQIGGSDKLCCYYEYPAELPTERMHSIISNTLAPYMMPDFWVRMDTMPRNANGKVMRNELPAPVSKRTVYIAPRTELEQRVADAVNRLLCLKDPISMDESFIDLGGDSMQAMKLSQKLSEQGIVISPSSMLRLKTINSIAASAKVDYTRMWSESQWEAIRNDYGRRNLEIEEVSPLSCIQDDMLIRHIITPESSKLRHIYVFDAEKLIQENTLRASLDSLSQRHIWLRTSIVYHDVTVFQQVISNQTIPHEYVIIPDADHAKAEVSRIIDRQRHLPYDLQRMTPMQAVCVCSEDGYCRLIITVFDIAQGIGSIRSAIHDLLQSLADSDGDIQLGQWSELLEEASKRKTDEAGQTSASPAGIAIPDGGSEDVVEYSSHPGKRPLVFVHTANTGYEAYYRLADRIGESCSFSVINQWNLFHPDQAVYSIPGIAANYVRLLKQRQPEGPYNLGGWCYGGLIAYEMACQLQAAGEKVETLILFDTHVMGNEHLMQITQRSHETTDRSYFETCHLFKEMRERGMLLNLIRNFEHVSYDIIHYEPSHYDGHIVYFKPAVIPAGCNDATEYYNRTMLSEFRAGNLENYVKHPEDIEVIMLPHEHDLMMDDDCLTISVPIICKLMNP